VVRVGATPIFVDSCPVLFNMNMADAARQVTANTKAIMPVHLFGQAAEMDGVLELARQYGLNVIEDAAQAMGATYPATRWAPLAISARSVFPEKNLGALGDAGALLTMTRSLRNERAFCACTAGAKYHHRCFGGNFRLDALQRPAMLSVSCPL